MSSCTSGVNLSHGRDRGPCADRVRERAVRELEWGGGLQAKSTTAWAAFSSAGVRTTCGIEKRMWVDMVWGRWQSGREKC